MTRKSFFQGAIILGAAGIFIKILGAVFRIPLANMIGPLGMSYYQSAYPVYVLFLTLATTGIPIAISKMVSERIATDNYYEASKVFKVSFIPLALIGVTSTAICLFGAEIITEIVGVPEARYSMRAIAPALMIVSVMAAFRGYFQGMQNMKLTAVSQSVEQLVRVTCGLFLAFYFLRAGLQYSAAGAAFGATAGAVAGLICVLAIYFKNRPGLLLKIAGSRSANGDSVKNILVRIIIFAVPITIGASIMPIMNIIDLGMVVRVLTSAGYDGELAKVMYGELSGMVGPLISLPQVLTQAVSMSLVPAISIAYKNGDVSFMHENIKWGLRCALIIGLPCAFGLMILSEQIMVMVYPLQRASAVSAAEILFIMGIGVVFLATVQTLTGVLQGIGKQRLPVRNLAIGAAVKLVLSYNLIKTPGIGAKGAAVGTVAAFMIASILNMIEVRRHTAVKLDLVMTYVKPAFAAITMAAAVWSSYKAFGLFLGNAPATLISIVLGAAIYFFMIFVFKAITKDELLKFPKGGKLVKIVDKFVK